jgi:hypothetical protein
VTVFWFQEASRVSLKTRAGPRHGRYNHVF